MARTPAQRAARARRRKARNSAPKAARQQPGRGARGPIFRNPQPVQGKKARTRKRNRGGMNPVGPGNNNAFMNMRGSRNVATTRRQQVVEEDEYIMDVTSSVGFATVSIPVNPGQSGTFPWGSKVAKLYDEYDYEYLEFYYKREVTEFDTNAKGKVILSFTYDATQALPVNKQQVEDLVPHADDVPSTPQGIKLAIDCARIRKNDSKYVRPDAQQAGTDLKTYDAGQLFVSTIGQASAAFVGELHVRYRVRFSEPILDQPAQTGGVIHFSGTVPTTADNFATAVLQPGGSPLLGGITAAANVITFPAGIGGNYFVAMSINSATSQSAYSMTGSAGATSFLLFTQGTRNATGAQNSLAGTTIAAAMVSRGFTVAPTGGVVTVTPSTIVGGAGMDLFIFSLPPTLLTVDEKEQMEIDDLQDRYDALEKRFARLEGCLSLPVVVEDEEKEGASIALPPKSLKRSAFHF